MRSKHLAGWQWGLMLLAIVWGLGFAGGTSAQAANTHFATRKITYHINGKSSYYHQVWTNAVKAWNSTKVVKLKPTTKKKAKIQFAIDKKSAGICPYVYTYILSGKRKTSWAKGYMHGGVMSKFLYSKEQRTSIAICVVGHTLGLRDNEIDWETNIVPATDRSDLAHAYAHIK
ncbi:hypothetical protein [Levilactobacillus zymae]|uniref:hypothetical protein n=1 Tax=Levilactobacillus zymae TaxID=267363 RepID=UPI0028BBB01B|nr:hypothetical protein [Levilactobacillus zymae]MDT6981547.1 hypothetical protein [Levilactobacillus zymae]